MEDCLTITISQDEKNCTTPAIGRLNPGSNQTFSGTQIGVCHNFSINMNLPLNLRFQHLNNNAWKGKLAVVHTRSNSFRCDPVTEWLDSNGRAKRNNKSSLRITCRATGNSKF